MIIISVTIYNIVKPENIIQFFITRGLKLGLQFKNDLLAACSLTTNIKLFTELNTLLKNKTMILTACKIKKIIRKTENAKILENPM